MLCDYGCGQEAHYQMKNGKWCCSEKYHKCSEMKKKFLNGRDIKKTCDKCHKSFDPVVFERHYNKCLVNKCLWCQNPIDKNKKFCSCSCSAKYSNKYSEKLINSKRGPDSKKENNTKIITVKQMKIWTRTKNSCSVCGTILWSDNTKCKKCRFSEKWDILKQKWLNGTWDGVNSKGTETDKHIRIWMLEINDNKCSVCGWSEINPVTKKSPLCMDHIDGNHKNNDIQNLRILCPNCHSLTPTYGSLNMGNGRRHRRKQ